MKKIALTIMALLLCFCFVACGEQKEQDELNKLVKNFIWENDRIEGDTALPDTLGEKFHITWELTTNENCFLEEKDGKFTIKVTDVTEWSDELILKAIITGSSEKVTAVKEFEIYARKKVGIDVDLVSFYSSDVSNNAIVCLRATIYQVVPGGFWVTDGEGHYAYAYGSNEGLKAGYEVEVTGEKSLYYSMYEIKDPITKVLDDSKSTYDTAKMATEITIDDLEAFSQAEKPDPTKFGAIYTIEGTIIKNELGGSYDYALESAYSDKAVALYNSQFLDENTLKDLEAHFGKYVTLTVLYWDVHSSKFVRVVPLTTVTEKAAPELTDAQKLAKAELVISKMDKEFAADVELPTDISGVTVTWTSSNENVIASNGKLGERTVTNQEAKLTAVLTVGSETKTVELDVVVLALEEKTCLEAVTAALNGEQVNMLLTGKIIALDSAPKNNYFYIADASGVAFVRSKLLTFTPEGGEDFKVGDVVKVLVKTTVYYNNNKEICPQLNALTVEKSDKVVEMPEAVEVSIETLADKPSINDTLSETEIKNISKNAWYGHLIKVTCYVSVRTSGSYVNAYLASDNSQTAPAAYYQHTSTFQDEIKALDGKQVTIVAPMYGYSTQYGWRLASYISCDVVE